MCARKFIVTSGLPYSNGRLHVGHIAGAYLPADTYVRYLRARGDDVRFVCVGLPISFLRTFRSFVRGTIPLMTWGGIRGGISIALALSLPASPQRDVLLFATYAVVLFSILVQGLSLGRVVRRVTS